MVRLAGSGSGALLAALLAVGYNAQQLKHIIDFNLHRLAQGLNEPVWLHLRELVYIVIGLHSRACVRVSNGITFARDKCRLRLTEITNGYDLVKYERKTLRALYKVVYYVSWFCNMSDV